MKSKRFPVDTLAGEVMVTLEQPPKGAAWYYRFILDGKRVYKTTGEEAPSKAESIARVAVKDHAQKGTVVKTHSLGDLVSQYLEECKGRHAASTNFERTRHLTAFQNQYGAHLPQSEEAATTLVQKYISKASSNFEYRKGRIVLSGFFSWMMQKRLMPWRVNPAAANFFERRPIPRKIRPVIEEHELRKLFHAAKATQVYPAIILVLSGLRPVSLDRVAWDSITWEPPRIRTEEKGNQRLQALSAWAAGELKEWKAANADKPLSVGVSITHRMMKMLRQLVGLPDHVTLQGLRRFTDFHLYQKGVSPQIAAKVLDHLPSTAQKHYVDYQTLDAKEAIHLLDFSEKGAPKSSEKASEGSSESKPS